MSLITISHPIGSDGNRIAHQVADALKLPLYDDAALRGEALGMGLHAEHVKGLGEKAPGFFDRVLNRKPELYLDLMQSVVYEVARRGEGVIVGHGSQVLLQDFGCALHVLIEAPVSARIEQLVSVQGLSRDSAAKLIHKNDSEKQGFFQFAFHKDWNDPALYDVCINTAKIGSERAVQLIVAAAQAPEMKSCSLNAVLAMQRLSLAKKIEAACIAQDIPLTLLQVDVPEKGVARVSGAASTAEDVQRIQQTVEAVPGVTEVRMDVSVMRIFL